MKFYLLKRKRGTGEKVLLRSWNSLEKAMPFLQWGDAKLKELKLKTPALFYNIVVSQYCKTEEEYNDVGAKGLSWFDKDGWEFCFVREDSPCLSNGLCCF